MTQPPPSTPSPQRPVALVTGASRGIGRAVAELLASKGYVVAVNYHHNHKAAQATMDAIHQAGGQAVAFAAGVDDVGQVQAMFKQVDALGPLAILVCNAGLTRDTLLGASVPEDFGATLDVNFLGTVNCCREAARRMISRRTGSIVNVSSVAAQHPGRGQSNYAASKGAVEAFTKALAVELAPRNIRVNAVAPGIINTDMTAGLQAMAPDELQRRILLRRLGQPHEVAAVIAFLAADAAYVTGQVWNVDGGFKME